MQWSFRPAHLWRAARAGGVWGTLHSREEHLCACARACGCQRRADQRGGGVGEGRGRRAPRRPERGALLNRPFTDRGLAATALGLHDACTALVWRRVPGRAHTLVPGHTVWWVLARKPPHRATWCLVAATVPRSHSTWRWRELWPTRACWPSCACPTCARAACGWRQRDPTQRCVGSWDTPFQSHRNGCRWALRTCAAMQSRLSHRTRVCAGGGAGRRQRHPPAGWRARRPPRAAHRRRATSLAHRHPGGAVLLHAAARRVLCAGRAAPHGAGGAQGARHARRLPARARHAQQVTTLTACPSNFEAHELLAMPLGLARATLQWRPPTPRRQEGELPD